jgi:CDP-4-dehydro-6-deoxyglucose reductase, E3
MVRISLAKSDRSFSVAAGEPLLEAALAAGLPLPHSCRGGNCGACRARLLTGEVAYPNGPPLGLTAAESADGLILLCQARACGDLCIETFEVTRADDVVVKRLPARIERAEAWAPDVLGLYLRLPAAEAFDFQAGQYIDILLPGGRRRSFSIASPPHAPRPLELHVRRVAAGEFTGPLFAEPAHGQRRLVTLEGPFGRFVYRPSTAPMLLVGGGTGLAPLKSLLRHVLETGVRRDVALYWGVRAEADLYALRDLDALVRAFPQFRYEVVLSEAGPKWRGRRGLVHEAVLADHARFGAVDIYASGPPAMVAAVRGEFPGRGADPARLFDEPFDYAGDPPARQRTSADTRS